MNNPEAGAAMAIPMLDAATRAAYTAFRDLGLSADAARDAIDAHVLDTIAAAAYERDGKPLTADLDDDTGGGGVAVRAT